MAGVKCVRTASAPNRDFKKKKNTLNHPLRVILLLYKARIYYLIGVYYLIALVADNVRFNSETYIFVSVRLTG